MQLLMASPNLQENNFMRFVYSFLLATCIGIAMVASAQQVREPKPTNSRWAQDYPPFRVAGNLYYVGTADLASYLVTTNAGNILINTGLASSDTQIIRNIRALGFSKKIPENTAYYTGAL